MTQEEKLEEAKRLYKDANADQRYVLERLFPELCESKDELIRQLITRFVIFNMPRNYSSEFSKEDCIAWLEKQNYEPNWCHHKVDLSNCSEEYRKAYYDGWNNCNMQHSQCESEKSDVLKCLINGMKFYYEDNEEATWGTEKFSMKVKDILAWLEKQGEQKPVKINEGQAKMMFIWALEKVEERTNKGYKLTDNDKNSWWNDFKTYALSGNKGEQKPADKVEQKFKVGDWVVSEFTGSVYQIKNCIETLSNHKYGYDLTNGGYIASDDSSHYHLWTIQDAKDGDVLHSPTHRLIWIYKDKDKYYAAINLNYADVVSFDNKIVVPSDVCPANRAQKSILFQKMEEAGYEWDSKKKELKQTEQSLAWSKEDEQNLNAALGYIDDEYLRRWLKDVIHVKYDNPAWSEEDERMYKAISIALSFKDAKGYLRTWFTTPEEADNWLKSLKERYTWKPTENQMKALKEACDEHWEPDGLDPLYTLYQDLKKLMEE